MYSGPIDNDVIADALVNPKYLEQIAELTDEWKTSFLQLQLGKLTGRIRDLREPYEIDFHYRSGDRRWFKHRLEVGDKLYQVVEGVLDILYENDLKVDDPNKVYATG